MPACIPGAPCQSALCAAAQSSLLYTHLHKLHWFGGRSRAGQLQAALDFKKGLKITAWKIRTIMLKEGEMQPFLPSRCLSTPQLHEEVATVHLMTLYSLRQQRAK